MRQRIARGLWPVGHRLPSLEALVAEFGVARVTVRQAVELLARDGLLSPQQGRGTFVTGVPPPGQWLQVHTSLEALAATYRDDKPEMVTIDERTAQAPLRPGDGTPAALYVHMRRVHSKDGRPYCAIHIYLAEDLFRRRPQRFRREMVIPLLCERPDTVAHARQVLTVGSADPEVARLLGIAVNAPVAEVRRVFTDAGGRVIYLAEVTYRGDFIHLDMTLKP